MEKETILTYVSCIHIRRIEILDQRVLHFLDVKLENNVLIFITVVNNRIVVIVGRVVLIELIPISQAVFEFVALNQNMST